MQPLAFLNGQFVPASELRISVADAGFVTGATATDLARTFAGQLYRLDAHLRRFRESCRLCRIPLPYDDETLRDAAGRLIEHNRGDGELALVMFATPGPLGRYLGISADGPPTVGMHTMPISRDRYASLFTEGARLVTPSIRQPSNIDPRAKVRSRLHWWLAEQEVRAIDSRAWALLLDEHGHVTETAAANFLAVIDGVVTSPRRERILNGVSLDVVQELCDANGALFAERPLTIGDCRTASEAMVCGTMFCLAGVRSIDGAELPWPGPVTQQIMAEWRAIADR